MKYFVALFLFLSIHLQAQESNLIIRPQTEEEAFSYIKEIIDLLPWFQRNRYQVVLPNVEEFNESLGRETSEEELKELEEFFSAEIYDREAFQNSILNLRDSEEIIQKCLEKLAVLKENWGFKVMDTYEVILTHYGPGGDCDPQKGTIRILTTPEGNFKRTKGFEVVVHEMVHIGIEENIVKKYQLTHWEKERVVDLICSLYLLPGYRTQKSGDRRVDSFVSREVIEKNLPAAIAAFKDNLGRL